MHFPKLGERFQLKWIQRELADQDKSKKTPHTQAHYNKTQEHQRQRERSDSSQRKSRSLKRKASDRHQTQDWEHAPREADKKQEQQKGMSAKNSGKGSYLRGRDCPFPKARVTAAIAEDS